MSVLVMDGIDWWALQTPDQPAIVFDGSDVVTFAELVRWSDAAAHALRERGVTCGDRIGFLGANSLEWCVAAMGAFRLGAVVVPYNNRFVADEIAYLVDDSDPALVLSDAAHHGLMTDALGSRAVQHGALADFTALRGQDAAPLERTTAQPDDPCVIVYTSGTSSRPKGVLFTHRSTLSFIQEFALVEPALRPQARMLFLLSMSGAPGILWHVLHPLTRGATLYYERAFDPQVALTRLREDSIDVFVGVPMLFEQIAALPGFADADLSSLKLVTVAGARVPVPLIETWLAKGVSLRQGYGMTELGGLSTINPAEQALTRPDSIGRGSVFARHRVVRPDGTECDAGEPGEIVVSGPSVTPGYWRNPEATAESLRDGWFHSGDVGTRDDEGYLRVVDRLKDIIISGGYNIAPSEIESVISELPAVAEVCVIAADDPRFGEAPVAVVRPLSPLSQEAVLDHCRKRLAKYKVPREVLLVEEPLPRMASGKVARRVIRDLHAPTSPS